MIYKLKNAMQYLSQYIDSLANLFWYPSTWLPVPDFNNTYDETML